MIVAIDESGDFHPNSTQTHVFLACHIRRATVGNDTKERQHRRWEQSLPKSARDRNGEVKGSLLSVAECDSFVDRVALSEPRIRVTMVGIVPADSPEEKLQEYRQYQLASCNDAALRCIKAGNKKGADHCRAVGDWLRALNHHQHLKLMTLCVCVAHSMPDVVGHAISGQYDVELGDLEYKIDRDFIKRGTPTQAWRRVLGSEVRRVVRADDSIPLLETWTDDHPFLKRFGNRSTFDPTPLFEGDVFMPSKTHWELRIADVVASITQRAHNRHEAVRVFNRLHSVFAGREGEKHLLRFEGFTAEAARHLSRRLPRPT